MHRSVPKRIEPTQLLLVAAPAPSPPPPPPQVRRRPCHGPAPGCRRPCLPRARALTGAGPQPHPTPLRPRPCGATPVVRQPPQSISDARHLLDTMRLGESLKRSVSPALGSGGSIDALPDGVLGHILGFLPAQEAVRTCVLARRWRHLWRTTPGLRVGSCTEYDGTSVKEQLKFVDHLLLLRGSSPLDICEFGFSADNDNHDESRVNLWFRHVVMCGARVLRLHLFGNYYFDLDDLPLVSQHLTKLYLYFVRVRDSFLNFSSCPALEHLELVDCDLSFDEEITSKSLKHLSLTDCVIFRDYCQSSRICISTPSLVSLHLDSLEGTPIFDTMPSLVKAFVRITEACLDGCRQPDYMDCTCLLCVASDSHDGSVLLKGLSQAQTLVLISEPDKIIFKSDLRWCPLFSNLKTLLLNDYWCTPDDFSALACILEHSPVLSKLTLELFSECRGQTMKWR